MALTPALRRLVRRLGCRLSWDPQKTRTIHPQKCESRVVRSNNESLMSGAGLLGTGWESG